MQNYIDTFKYFFNIRHLEYFLQNLKKTLIISSYKSGASENITDYRPTSLSLSLCLFQKCLKNRLVQILNYHNFFF